MGVHVILHFYDHTPHRRRHKPAAETARGAVGPYFAGEIRVCAGAARASPRSGLLHVDGSETIAVFALHV